MENSGIAQMRSILISSVLVFSTLNGIIYLIHWDAVAILINLMLADANLEYQWVANVCESHSEPLHFRHVEIEKMVSLLDYLRIFCTEVEVGIGAIVFDGTCTNFTSKLQQNMTQFTARCIFWSLFLSFNKYPTSDNDNDPTSSSYFDQHAIFRFWIANTPKLPQDINSLSSKWSVLNSRSSWFDWDGHKNAWIRTCQE